MTATRLPATLLLSALALLTVFVALLALASGPLHLPLSTVLAGFGLGDAPVADYERVSLLQVRAPRVCLSLLIGAALALAGAAMQGVFRNPLADPSLAGVSAGAALASTAWLALRVPLQLETLLPTTWALPTAAFIGGLLAAALVARLARDDQHTSLATLLLAGLAVNAIASAGVGLFQQLANDSALRDITAWLYGSLGRSGWAELAVAAPLLLTAILLIPLHAPALNALLLGEAEAVHLGVEVERIKRHLLLLIVLATSTSVALAGIIGFVGLLVPHLARLLIGPSHRVLLPACALLGAALLTAADLAARTWLAPLELSVGIYTAVLGGPFFLYLLTQRRGRLEWGA